MATTDFEVVVDPDGTPGSSDVHYTSLNAAETDCVCDLTAATTLEFPHGGITGSVGTGDSVTGKVSGATATVVAITDTAGYKQILLESIASGPFQNGEQVYETDGVNYVTISATGDDARVLITGTCTGGTADTTAVGINGYTCDATNYLKVAVDSGSRHSGTYPSGNTYRLEVSGTGIDVMDDYVQICDLAIKITTTANSQSGIVMKNDGVLVDGCVITIANSGSHATTLGIYSYSASGTPAATIQNNIIYGFAGTSNAGVYTNATANNTLSLYNKTKTNCVRAVNAVGGTVTVKNTITYGNTTDDYGGTFDAASDYNATDGDGTGQTEANSIDISGWSGKEEEIFADYASDDYTLMSNATPVSNLGTNLYASGVTTDIKGNARPSTGLFDIGAHEFLLTTTTKGDIKLAGPIVRLCLVAGHMKR